MTDVSDIRALLDELAGCDEEAKAALLTRAPPPWRRALEELTDGPDPVEAVVRASRLPDEILATALPRPLCRLMHQGGYPARLLAADPSAASMLTEVPPKRSSHEDLVDELMAGIADVGPDEALGRVRTREYLRLCRREVEGAALEEVGHDLSALAAACIEAGVRHLGIDDRIVVFGMGKLGGHELNFLSDIDLVFVHADDLSEDPEAPKERGALIELHDKLRTLVRLLEGSGRFRPLFRVDLRLRPFGSRGPLSMSVSATEAYYERHGRPWERQAWLRARPLAGNPALGEQMLRRLSPFVYRRSVSPTIFAEIAELMHRARREASGHHDTAQGAVDLKLDTGGIREVEFSVQALQLLHGGKNPSVRSRSTLSALDRLLAAGLISDREHRDLVSAYRWLRRVEHRLQLAEGRQTHRMPADIEARALLALRLADAAAPTAESLVAELDHALAQHRAHVSAVARTMSGEAEAEVEDPRSRARSVVLDMGAPTSVRYAALAELGVRDPQEVEALLQHLHSRENGAFSASGPARQGAENLLLACLDSADPDAAIVRLVEFAAQRPAHYGVWRFFAELEVHGHGLVRLTAELFGTSEALSRGLIGFPVPRGALRDESIGILQAATASQLPDAAALAHDLEEHDGDERGLEAGLLRFEHAELVAIALHDLGRRPDPLAVGRSLSDLADLILRVLARDLAAELASDRRLHGMQMGLFALGKYGMQAMDYGSDLDLMFVFETDDEHTGRGLQRDAIRAGQRLLSRLTGRTMGMRMYEVDMRLRPSGREGLLVSSLAGFRRYHERPLAIWERLALLRLRPVASVDVGPQLVPPRAGAAPPSIAGAGARMAAGLVGELCAAVEQVVRQSLLRPLQDPTGDAASPLQIVSKAVRRLKNRIESELSRETRDRFNAKTGRGGALELELLVSALQLLHAREHPDVLVRGIVDAIDALERIGALPDSEASALRAAYAFQRRLLNRLRMTHHGPGRIDDPDRFAQNSPRLVSLARRMGLPSREALVDRFFETREVVRGAFDRHLQT